MTPEIKTPPEGNAPADGAPVASRKRKAFVIVVVLVVIAALSLSAYRYSDSMLTEYRAAESVHRSVQTRHLADSGIHHAMALLRDPINFLDGNTWNNPSAFGGIEIKTERGVGKFSIICPPDPDDASARGFSYGVIDEGGKINLNSFMKIDPSGDTLRNALMKLPNMTEEIADAILDWMDPDSDVRTAGAENEYYTGLTPPYRCKNGPIDSVDELLLVKGVTRELLYGVDANRNNVVDDDETGSDIFPRGWASLLTVHSREQNRDIDGNAAVYVNVAIEELEEKVYKVLGPELGQEVAAYIVMRRQWGKRSSNKVAPASLANYTPKFPSGFDNKIESIYDLIDTKAVTGVGKSKKAYDSPLSISNMEKLREVLPKLFERVTFTDEIDPEIPARVNINTAPREVLAAIPGMSDAMLEKIITTRPKQGGTDMPAAIFHTPAWLITEAGIDPKDLTGFDQLITTRTQVYRVQSVGYYDAKGPAIRVEAVIDTNPGPNGARPRIVAWRDLSELGKGFKDNLP